MNNTIIIRHESNCEIPCVKVTYVGDNPHPRFNNDGYLMPFRAYRFQVCGNVKGERDCGSSDVHNMQEVLALKYADEFNTFAYNYLREQAMTAIMRWQPDYRFGVSMSDDDVEIFEAFLKECFEWVKSLG